MRLFENLMHFGRVLRRAGLVVGPDRIAVAARALERVDLGDREQVYWALHCLWVTGREQRQLFDEAFRAFLELAIRDAGSASREPSGAPRGAAPRPLGRRVGDALAPLVARSGARRASAPAPELQVAPSHSQSEGFRRRDFEQMSVDELHQATRAIERLMRRLGEREQRRRRAAPRGEQVDLRATLRESVRSSGQLVALRYRRATRRPPPLVVLCDVSGSMDRYARVMLHFVHALAARARPGDVHGFVFGTHLENVSRQLRCDNVDDALSRVAEAVDGWKGGTRIGASLERFNRAWARRVLGRSATVLLITDGLDRDGAEGIDREMRRLSRHAGRLVWLNPLLRYSLFQPLAAGVRAILPHVDEMRPVHCLDSLSDLVDALCAPRTARQKGDASTAMRLALTSAGS